MGDLIIRAASPADISAITAIYGEAVLNSASSYELEPPDQSEMTARYRAVVEGGFSYQVAETGGAVVGFAYASPFRPRPAYRYSVEDSIYVAADRRGKGIGTSLLKSLIEDIEKGGFRQVIAVIGDGHDAAASVRLHRQAGFRNAGSLEGSGYKFGRWLDTTLMQLSLNEGSATIPPER